MSCDFPQQTQIVTLSVVFLRSRPRFLVSDGRSVEGSTSQGPQVQTEKLRPEREGLVRGHCQGQNKQIPAMWADSCIRSETAERQIQQTRGLTQPCHEPSADLDPLSLSGPQFPHL